MNATDKRYPVQERFMAFQGEGVHAGKSAFFIRLYGCPVKCPWCDSAGTWHHDYKPESMESIRMDVPSLVGEAVKGNPEFVVLTGGEPCVHDLWPLICGLHAAGLPVHLETCGAFKIPAGLAWITVSPKDNAPPLTQSVEQASEFKIIVEDAGTIAKWATFIEEEGAAWGASVWLHPEWSKREDKVVLESICDAATKGLPGHRRRFRAGWQLHKLYDVDALDGRTKPRVPLGGNPALGL